jgi:hypothetical protein
MLTSIYADGARSARKEYLRLTGLSISTPTDEQIAAAKVKNEKYKPRGSFKIEWEPMSYRLEGGKYGNTEADFLAFTFGLTDEELQVVREQGWRGAGAINKRLSIPANVSQAKEEWTRFMVYARNAGLDMGFDEQGNLTSKDVGAVFEVEAGIVALPTRIQDPATGKWRDSNPDKGEASYNRYMRLPVRKATDYVQPEDIPVKFITNTDDDTPAAEAATTTGSTVSGGVSAEQLASALVEAGIIGSPVADFATATAQVNAVNKAGGRAPVLFADEVQKAAQAGGLIDYAAAKGAVTVVDGSIVKAA